MKKLIILIILLLSLMTYGCATPQIAVTYNSDPPGSSLYTANQLMGYCPITLYYNIAPQHRQLGYMKLQETQVKWVSGAYAKIIDLTAYLATGPYQQLTFKRPEGIEGFETDAKFGLEVQKVRLMQQQVQAQQDANLWQIYSTIANQNSTVNLKTNCTSNVIGGTVFTNCR
ncbi:MAG: hypothetical protein ABII13_00645 [Patescibacteria group bacterium]